MPNPTSPEEPWPVRTLSGKIRDWIGRLGEVWVEGQVTEMSLRPGASVAFVTLRDPHADVSLRLTIRREVMGTVEPPLAEGQQIVVRGKPAWHMLRGTLSLDTAEVRAIGLGALLARLERLRTMLAQEGLFDPARKKPLPFLPRTVGLVCGRESDAKHDVVENARRRWPAVRFAIKEVRVQGAYAVTDVIEAVQALDRDSEVDVIVVARGGGDVQELLPFSDEALVRAVAGTRTPVVSAIGHEQHTPLLDFVADWRASTPTDAGKRVVPDVAEEQQRILQLRRAAWRTLDSRLDRHASDVDALRQRARRCTSNAVDQHVRDVAAALARVTALSPKATLDRGYAVVQRGDGTVVRDPAEPGERLHVRVATGAFEVTVATPARETSPR